MTDFKSKVPFESLSLTCLEERLHILHPSSQKPHMAVFLSTVQMTAFFRSLKRSPFPCSQKLVLSQAEWDKRAPCKPGSFLP